MVSTNLNIKHKQTSSEKKNSKEHHLKQEQVAVGSTTSLSLSPPPPPSENIYKNIRTVKTKKIRKRVPAFLSTKRIPNLKKKLKSNVHEKLVLTVNVIGATDVSLKSLPCNALCCVIYNNQISTTHPIKNSTSPAWNKTFKFTLPTSPKNDTIKFIIFDVLDKKILNRIEQRNKSSSNFKKPNISHTSFQQEDIKLISKFPLSSPSPFSPSSTSSTTDFLSFNSVGYNNSSRSNSYLNTGNNHSHKSDVLYLQKRKKHMSTDSVNQFNKSNLSVNTCGTIQASNHENLEYNIDNSTDSFIDEQLYSNHQYLQSMDVKRKFIYLGETTLQIRSIFKDKGSFSKDHKLISPAKLYDVQSKLYSKTGSLLNISFQLEGKHIKSKNSTTKLYSTWSDSVTDFINSKKLYTQNSNTNIDQLDTEHKFDKNEIKNKIFQKNMQKNVDNDMSSFKNVTDSHIFDSKDGCDGNSCSDIKSLDSAAPLASQSLLDIFDSDNDSMLDFDDDFVDYNLGLDDEDDIGDVADEEEDEEEDEDEEEEDDDEEEEEEDDEEDDDYDDDDDDDDIDFEKDLDKLFDNEDIIGDMEEDYFVENLYNNENTDIDDICTIIEDMELENTDSQFMEGITSEEDENEQNSRLLFKKRKAKLNTKKKKPQWVISKKKHAAGVVILDIIGISDLPSLKNLVRYTMDPFIILTFGRRVFKSSWKRHNLNPTYNERVIFDMYDYEKNFNFDFKVIDRDSLSSHDKIANVSISFEDMLNYQNESHFEIPLQFNPSLLKNQKHIRNPKLKLNFKFLKYENLNTVLWNKIIQDVEYFDVIELSAFLEKVGDFQAYQIHSVFEYFKKSPWSHDMIAKNELIDYFNHNFVNFNTFTKCPFCNYTPRKTTKNLLNSKLRVENDLVTHMSVCNSPSGMKTLKASYVSPSSASKKWVSRFFVKLLNGKYALGSNNANILVQDRDTGFIVDEKISAHVKLGIRILYKKRRTPELKNFKILLRNQTIKQGLKFDNPLSVKYIDSFIKFHQLDLSECSPCEYKNFNEFFYRKLKPNARLPESDDPRILISPADCRCTVFQTVSKSKEMWIKGDGFTLERLTQGYFDVDRDFTIAIFRLAPQDYHRFHSPCNGVIGKPIFIDGEYYTVNPMAIRTELDVFGENIRCVIPIQTEEFGEILYIPVGAMMVGSIILTCKEGDKVKRGQELGYFKFGGSTILLVINKNKILFDVDLLKNSNDCIETLVKVGMSIGHTPDIPQFKRHQKSVSSMEMEKIKKIITSDKDTTWEYITANEQLDESGISKQVYTTESLRKR